jgi:predicted small lipoprotein YifL
MNWKLLLVIAGLTLTTSLTACGKKDDAAAPDATKTETTKTETTETKPADAPKGDAMKPADAPKGDTTKTTKLKQLSLLKLPKSLSKT